jgi:hypothetical protein
VKVVSLRHRNRFQSTFLSVVIFIYIYLWWFMFFL